MGQKAAVQDRPGLELLVLALTGKKSVGAAGFAKVIKMIDNMVGILSKEQADDNDKKEYCAMQFDVSDDSRKALEHAIAGEEAGAGTAADAIATLTQEIAALTAGIKALDASVVDATAQRKDENAEYKALIASNTAATQVLGFAKNRLNKFSGAGMVKVANGACPTTDDFPHDDVSQEFAHGAESEPETFSCTGACCVRFCCGSQTCWSS